MQQSEGIEWGVSDSIGRILFKPQRHFNSITSDSCRVLVKAIHSVLDAEPRVVLLSAEGTTFCVGGDIQELASAGAGLSELVDELLTPMHPALLRLANAPVPVVAAVNGAVGGAGIGLALCADFVLAAESVKLRTGYAVLGLSPDVGASYFLSRRVGPVKAQQWLMLSQTVDAQACLASGAVDAVYPDAQLADEAERLVTQLAQSAQGALASIKRLCGGLPERGLEAHLRLEHAFLRDQASGSDAWEGLRAYIERRKPSFGATCR